MAHRLQTMDYKSVVALAAAIISYEEGYESKPYHDTEGYPTVGYGLKIGHKDQPIEVFSSYPEMPELVALAWLDDRISLIVHSIESDYRLQACTFGMNPVQKAVVVSMIYQLGTFGFLKFKNTIVLMEDMNYSGAALEMLDSKWATQAYNRATRHAEMMESGELLHEYV